VDTPGPQEAIDEDVKVFLVVVPAFDDVSAVAVDEGRQMGADGGIGPKNGRPKFEIAQPEIMGMIPSPSTADLLFGKA